MNREKAREFFSAYYDGTLETGLRQTLEQRLRADTELHAEYQAFQGVMADLDTLKFEEIEVPMYLSDRIATRLESVEAKRPARASLLTLWARGFGLSAVAAAAVLFAFLSVVNRGPASTSQAGLTSIASEDKVVLTPDGRDVALDFRPSVAQTVSVLSAGKELQKIELAAGQQLHSPLRNNQPETAIFEIRTTAPAETRFVAVPGTQRKVAKSGQGDLREFAAALAGFYRVPVELNVADPSERLTWDFDGNDLTQSASRAVEPLRLNVLKLDNGMVGILDR